MRQLAKKIFFNFNVANYGKRLEPAGFTRFHNRVRYDENYQLKTNKQQLNEIKEKEDIIFDEIFQQLKIKYDDYFETSMKRKDSRFEELPEVYGDYQYYTKHGFMGSNNNNYDIVFRRNLKTGIEECILDIGEINFLKPYQNTAMFSKMVLSDCHQYVAFGLDLESNEHIKFYIKDIRKNIILKDRLTNIKNIQFNKDSKSLVYVKHDGRHWTHQVYNHIIGQSQKSDELIYEEQDESYYTDIAVTKDKKYLIINSATKLNAEIRVIERKPGLLDKEDIQVIFDRRNNNRAFANHAEDKFYILTDADGVYDYKIITLQDSELQKRISNTNALIKYKTDDFYIPKEGEVLKEIDIFKSHIVMYNKKDGDSYMTIINQDTKEIEKIQLKNEFSVISPGMNESYDCDTFRFHVDTPFEYNKVYDYSFKTKKVNLLEESNLEGPKFDPSVYSVTRTYAPSQDGTQIPITLLHKKNIKLNRRNKLLLNGYGHYGLSLDADFNIVNLKALEENWVLAFAHVRGGNERGWNWHNQAIKENKYISYQDFISSAEHLVASGYTHPSLMCAYGSSAGGTLVGSAINLRPNLFKAVILHFPFLDILTTLLDKELELTQTDHDEFGDPTTNSKIYDLISSYCPYENILENVEYPSVLVVCGSDDYRSPLWNVLKYVKRFRNKTQSPQRVEEFCSNNIVVNIVNSGHFGESSVESGVSDKALQFAFLDYVVMEKNKDIKIE